MRNIYKNILFVSLTALLMACSGSKQPSEPTSSPISEFISQPVSEPASVTPSSAILQSSAPSQNSDDSRQMINDQLYTDSGLKVYFKAQGARIDKITWGANNKQIAKDGFTVGRCANRLAGGKFTINGTQYQAKLNDGNNSLHGGGSSWQGPFATANWTKVEQTSSTITYSLTSRDGDNGYPGNMEMTVKYTLSQEGELSIEYTATTDKDTLCNPTNHLFMAVNGDANRNYPNIKLWINADYYTPLSNQIPTGKIDPVAGTQFDYSTEKAFDGSKSYDDNYVLKGEGYRKAATMTGTSLGLKIDVYTDRAGLQLYKDGSGNICLETQQFPDMINHPEFAEYGTTVLKAGETFYSKTAYVFSESK